MRQHVAYIKKFYQFVSFGIPVEQMNAIKLTFWDPNYNYIESFLKDFKNVDTPSAF